MSSQLKKLGNLGVDPSSARANESFCLIGTPLPPLEKSKDTGEFVPLWKQDVRDEQGRKRLHRAFTGGFSAGYFNTVKASEAVGMVLPLARSLLLVLASLSTTPTTMMSTAASRRTETVLRATLLIEKKTKRYLLEARQIPGVDLVLCRRPRHKHSMTVNLRVLYFPISPLPKTDGFRWPIFLKAGSQIRNAVRVVAILRLLHSLSDLSPRVPFVINRTWAAGTKIGISAQG